MALAASVSVSTSFSMSIPTLHLTQVRVSKWTSELEKMFYGSAMAYDKAVKGEDSMHDALFRNVYGEESEGVEFGQD